MIQRNTKRILSYIIIVFSITYCVSKKTNVNKQRTIEGLYATKLRPADIGEPYRIYFKFSKNGTVISMDSSLECDSVKKIIDKDYAEKGTYNFKGKDSLKFTFINNRVNNTRYAAINSVKIVDQKTLKAVTIIQVKNARSYQISDTYNLCP